MIKNCICRWNFYAASNAFAETDRPAHIRRARCSISRYAVDFTERPHYPRKLVLANARSGKTVPTRGSRAGPTTHPHSRIKHKCHLPMPDPHEPRASLFFFLFSPSPSTLRDAPRLLSRRSSFSRFETPVVVDSFTCPCCHVRQLSRRYFL